ncbi:MAG: ECF transporter S component [Armatimonadota bacterium]
MSERSDARGPTIAEELAWARELSLGGLFIALGVVIPIAFHALGGGRLGPVFLPMYLPVLVCGMLVSPGIAAAVGVLTPLLSSALTGMPPVLPTMPLMVAELGVMGAVASLLHRRARLPALLTTPITLVVGRAVLGLCVVGAVSLLPADLLVSLPAPMRNPLLYVIGATITALPGLALQLIAVPAVVALVERGPRTAPATDE